MLGRLSKDFLTYYYLFYLVFNLKHKGKPHILTSLAYSDKHQGRFRMDQPKSYMFIIFILGSDIFCSPSQFIVLS